MQNYGDIAVKMYHVVCVMSFSQFVMIMNLIQQRYHPNQLISSMYIKQPIRSINIANKGHTSGMSMVYTSDHSIVYYRYPTLMHTFKYADYKL